MYLLLSSYYTHMHVQYMAITAFTHTFSCQTCMCTTRFEPKRVIALSIYRHLLTYSPHTIQAHAFLSLSLSLSLSVSESVSFHRHTHTRAHVCTACACKNIGANMLKTIALYTHLLVDAPHTHTQSSRG